MMAVTQNFPKPKGFVPDPTWPEGHAWHGNDGRCKAWNPKYGRQCLRRVSSGKRVCKFDGGNAPNGVAHYNFKHGRDSVYHGSRLKKKFEHAFNDPDLLDGSPDLRAMDARNSELMDMLADGVHPARILKRAARALDLMIRAEKRGDRKMIVKWRLDLARIIESGAKESDIWDEFYGNQELRRRMSETETRRRERVGLMFMYEEVMEFFQGLNMSIRKHVSDPEVLTAIANGFAETTGFGDLRRIATSRDTVIIEQE